MMQEEQEIIEKDIMIVVTATMYYPVVGQTDNTPNITADGSKINVQKAGQHKWIAVSRDLLERWGGSFKYGDKVRIVGAGHKDGIYEIHDTMNKKWKNKIDFLESPNTPIYKFNNVKIYKV